MARKQKEPLLAKYKYEVKEVFLSEILVDVVKTKEGRQKSHSRLGTVNDVILNQTSMLKEGKNYRVIEGRKRINNLLAEKKETVMAKVYKNLPTEIDRCVLLVSNFQRSASPVTEAEAIEELLKLGKTVKEISEITGISEGRLRQRTTLLKKLPKEIADLLRRAEIPESTAKKIASLPRNVQNKILKEEKITGDVVKKHHREYLDKQLSFDDMDLPKKVKGEAKAYSFVVIIAGKEKQMNRKELFTYLEETLPATKIDEEIVIKRKK